MFGANKWHAGASSRGNIQSICSNHNLWQANYIGMMRTAGTAFFIMAVIVIIASFALATLVHESVNAIRCYMKARFR